MMQSDKQQGQVVPMVENPVTNSDSIMAVISRAAQDPSTDVGKLERLLDMYTRISAQSAKAAYISALVIMKPLLPVIDRKGRIVITDKADRSKVIQTTPYALWEDIDAAITPILSDHGFVLTFRSGVADDGKITVTGVLAHNAGHTEETTVTLPHDSSGSKNAVQAVGSSTSYGKRMTATLLLNIRTKGEDDDGSKGGGTESFKVQTGPDRKAMAKKWMDDAILLLKTFKTSQELAQWHTQNVNAIAAGRGFNEALHGRLVKAIQDREAVLSPLANG